MKIKDIWQAVAHEELVIITKNGGEIIGNLWKDDVDKPELLEREIVLMKALEKRVIMFEVK